MAQEVSFAGINLTVSTAEMQAAAAAKFPGPQIHPSAARGWPGATVTGQFESPDALELPVRLGSLFWPTGASRFAVGHFCATADQVAKINKVVGAEGLYPGQAQPFRMVCGESAGILTNLYMLPPRPFFNFGGGQLYIVTLVDARYWWRFRVTADTDTQRSDLRSWDALVGELVSALGTFDGVGTYEPNPSAKWGTPPVGLDLRRVPAAFALDAVAYMLGKRVRRLFTGAYQVCSPGTAATEIDADIAQPFFNRYLMAGGNAYDEDEDGAATLPEKGQVAFTQADGGMLVISKTLSVLDSTNFATTQPRATKGWRANWLVDMYPYGYAETAMLDAYVTSLVTAWGYWQQSAANYCFAGVVPWLPEAGCDHIEYHVSHGFSYTAVRRPPWDDGVTELLGLQAEGSAPATGGSGDVFLTVKDLGTRGLGADDALYYDARLNTFDSPAWVDDDTAPKVWLEGRRGEPLNPGDIVSGHAIGTHAIGADSRDLYACIKSTLTDVVYITSTGTVSYGGRTWYPGKVRYHNRTTHQHSDGNIVWVTNWFDKPNAFDVGYEVLGRFVDWIDPSGTGTRKPAYEVMVTGFELDKLLKCINNVLFVHGGCVEIAGDTVHVRKGDGSGDFTDVACPLLT